MSDMDISKMDFKQLRNEVQLLRDEFAVFKRKYSDTVNNLDSDNFGKAFTAEQNNMKAQLRVTAASIETVVSDLVNYSKITQTANMIQSVVSKSVDLSSAEPISSLEKATDTTKLYVVQTKVDGKVTDETYYYYDEILKDWAVLTGNSINTVFEQTASGFRMRGNVKISGSLIVDGEISGDRIRGGTIVGSTIETAQNGGVYSIYDHTGLHFYDSDDQTEGWAIEPSSSYGGVLNYYINNRNCYIFGTGESGSGYAYTDMVIKALNGQRGRFVVDVTNSSNKEVKFVGLTNKSSTEPYIYANEKLLATQDWVKALVGA